MKAILTPVTGARLLTYWKYSGFVERAARGRLADSRLWKFVKQSDLSDFQPMFLPTPKKSEFGEQRQWRRSFFNFFQNGLPVFEKFLSDVRQFCLDFLKHDRPHEGMVTSFIVCSRGKTPASDTFYNSV